MPKPLTLREALLQRLREFEPEYRRQVREGLWPPPPQAPPQPTEPPAT